VVEIGFVGVEYPEAAASGRARATTGARVLIRMRLNLGPFGVTSPDQLQ
jgi:hypothetical protein